MPALVPYSPAGEHAAPLRSSLLGADARHVCRAKTMAVSLAIPQPQVMARFRGLPLSPLS